MALASQLGVKDEVTYGTPVVVDRFQEFLTCGIKPVTGRNTSKGLRTGQRVSRADRSVPYVTRYEGSVTQEVLSSGFGFWLKHLLGGSITSTEDGDNEDVWHHEVQVGSLCSKGFTMQVNLPLGACGDTNQPFTWSGGKVKAWSLACAKEGNLILEVQLVFKNGTTATALASASYPAGAEVLSWLGAFVTIAETPVLAESWKLNCDNKLKVDRLMLGDGTIQQPVEDDYREFSVELGLDWENLDLYNALIANTAEDSTVAMTMGAGSPTIIGEVGDITSSVLIELPAVRIDDAGTTIDGPKMLTQSVKGMPMNSSASGNDAITLTYTTLDATP